ncbi:MAG: response regulator [Verrucomicrobia bacterium]|nr:response regulator [Verrucomicrobiota bacterium]
MSAPGFDSRQSVRKRLFRLILLTSGLAVFSVAIAVAIYESTTFRPRELDRLKNTSRLLLEVLPATLDFGGADNAGAYLKTYAEETQPGVAIAALYDSQGALFASFNRKKAAVAIPLALEPAGHRFTAHELALWQPVKRGETTVGHIYLLKILPPLHARLPQYAIMAGAVLFALVIVGIVLIRGVRTSFLQPLSTLLATTTHVTEYNDYTARAKLGRLDELGLLATAFNRMLEVIGQRDTDLRQANALIRDVFAATTEVAIIACDTKGVVSVFNTGAERLLGYTSTEIVNHTTPLLWHKSTEMEVRAAALTLQLGRPIAGFDAFVAPAREGTPDAREWTYVRKDGKELHVYLVITAMHDAHGNPVGFLGVASDITRRKQAEDERERLQGQLIQAQKMEAVGQLAGGVAHDFNNILAAMIMNVGLMRDVPGISAELRASLDEQHAFVDRAANLTRQLLLFGRREVMQKQLLDLDSLLGNHLKMLRRLIGENISVEFKGNPKATWIFADGGMIEQVVMNLVVNARDAMQAGGRITITTEIADLAAPVASSHPEARAGRFVRLIIADTGSGMDQATQQHIFEPFFTTKAQGKGTGLGLATVYGIVKRHEGWIEVESALGQGTAFRIHLPASSSTPEPGSRSPDFQQAAGGHETIFLVEDDESVRIAALAVLSHAGYKVITADNGEQALKIWSARQQKVDLLLTDMIMPEGLTGLDLVKRLRKDDPALRVIVMSGYSLELSQQGVLDDDGPVYLAKPFEPAILLRSVRQCLDRV